ncbi:MULTISPECIES: hypothetical protein [Actinomyces]|uniref:Uncharacterized protein n=1 Tax=Actinomyces marmotae TaxID=2737173 RepID=A0A6M8B228_9ACTO|nr:MULTISPECIES: hypothetical protein [Actinomyces]QKD80398.1 hypothetical protein HPC72_09410 [Actinomyces marmotae]
MSQPMTPGQPYQPQSAPSAPGVPGGYQAQYQQPQPAQYVPGQQMPGQPVPAKPAGSSMLSALLDGTTDFSARHSKQIMQFAVIGVIVAWALWFLTGIIDAATGVEFGSAYSKAKLITVSWWDAILVRGIGGAGLSLVSLLTLRLLLDIARNGARR